MKLNEVVLRNNVPVMMEMDDDITGSMICGAPIMIDGKHVATWICCSYDDEDAKKMESVYKVQWQLGRIFSEYAFSSQILAKGGDPCQVRGGHNGEQAAVAEDSA